MGYSNRWLLGLCQFVKLSTSTFSVNQFSLFLRGGFIFFLFGGRFPFWLIFFRWVVQPPSRFFLPQTSTKSLTQTFRPSTTPSPKNPSLHAMKCPSADELIDLSAPGCEVVGVRPKGGGSKPGCLKIPLLWALWYAEPRFRSKSRMNFGMNLQCLVVSPMRCLSVYWIWKLFVAKETLRPTRFTSSKW